VPGERGFALCLAILVSYCLRERFLGRLESRVRGASVDPAGANGYTARMLEDTLAEIEGRIEKLGAAGESRKEELVALFAQLKGEVLELSKTRADDAESITRFAGLSTHEAMREQPNIELSDLALRGLSGSVEGFEASHPRLVETVNSICMTLANLGI